jgi:hypothetical protein
VTVIENFPRPENEKQLKSFLGMIGYYRKFIPRFSKIATPMHSLLKKGGNIRVDRRTRECIPTVKRKIDIQTNLTIPRLYQRVHTDH